MKKTEIDLEPKVWRTEDCVSFLRARDRWGGFSNMAGGFPINVDKVFARTAEALYQACRFPKHPEIQLEILNEGSPIEAKRHSRAHTAKTRSDWNEVRIDVMRWTLQAKYQCNSQEFGELLFATQGKAIVEESWRDQFWGAKPDGDGGMHGANVLGQLLTELRDDLPVGVLPPLDIPDFLLMGEPARGIPPHA